MRKIIVLSFITLDGVMQAPGGPEEDTSGGFKYGGWTVPCFDEFSGKIMGEQMSKPFELLLGRKTFEIFALYWPQHEASWLGINSVTKYVASNTLTKHGWNNSKFLNGNVADKVKQLKAQIRELERLLGRKTQEAEILKEAVEIIREKKLVSPDRLPKKDDFR